MPALGNDRHRVVVVQHRPPTDDVVDWVLAHAEHLCLHISPFYGRHVRDLRGANWALRTMPAQSLQLATRFLALYALGTVLK
jgi:hypothetical protein